MKTRSGSRRAPPERALAAFVGFFRAVALAGVVGLLFWTGVVLLILRLT